MGSASTLPERRRRRYLAGVDVGGTTLTAGLVSGGRLRTVQTTATAPERPPEEIVETIANLVEAVSGTVSIEALGAGVPTPLRPDGDRLVPCDNLPTMGDYPLRTGLEARLRLPVLLENDANVMVLGEQRYGALRGCRHCACLTLGTGLGCGLFLDGSLYRGATLFAGEVWNIPAGENGNLEDTVSAQALREMAASEYGRPMEPHRLYEAYRRGDPHAAQVFARYGEAVGQVAIMILALLDPEKVAVGGGIAGSWRAFGEALRRTVAGRLGEEAARRVVPAELSNRAAVLGAAALAEQRLQAP